MSTTPIVDAVIFSIFSADLVAQTDTQKNRKQLREDWELARRLEESHARTVAALGSLLDKLEVMGGCNENDMDGPEALPEFDEARASLKDAKELK